MFQPHKAFQASPPRTAHDDGGVRYSHSCGYHTKGYRRCRSTVRRLRKRNPRHCTRLAAFTAASLDRTSVSAPTPLPLSLVTIVVGDDKPYLPDRGTNDCDKPGWCSGPSYDPVTVVTRVQIPLRASPRFGVCRCLPGWCSGPSYDPVTVVTRVQIPLRAFSTNNSSSVSSGPCKTYPKLNQRAERQPVGCRRTSWRKPTPRTIDRSYFFL